MSELTPSQSGIPGVTDVDRPSYYLPPSPFESGISNDEMNIRMENFKAWYEQDRKLDPEPPPVQNRKRLYLTSEAARRSRKNQERSGELLIYSSIVGSEIHSSVQPLESLSRISFSEMLVRKVHLGRYLLCRSIFWPVRFTAFSLIVEDPEGLVNKMTVYNFPTVHDSSTEYISCLFPLGTILAIREPAFRTSTEEPHPVVTVNSPSDVVVLGPGSTFLCGIKWKTGHLSDAPNLPTTANNWKDLGNSHFKQGRWLPAAVAYSRGLELDPTAHALRLNRAEAYLRLNFYSPASSDVQSVLAADVIPEASRSKALFRLAKAKYGQRDYEIATEKFKEWNVLHPDNTEGISWLERSRARLMENQTGCYNWLELVKQSVKTPHIDIADFRGPVEVRSRDDVGGGRGVFATRDIKIGELLIVEKPFVSVFAQDLPKNERTILCSLLTNTVWPPTQSGVLPLVAEKIYGNPELHGLVFSLYAGSKYGPPLPFHPSQSSNTISLTNPLAPVIDIDIERLEWICTYNAFQPNSLTVYGTPEPPELIHNDKALGLYLFPSLFNHACLAKTSWACVGDTMTIRACQGIAAGEEITLPYNSGEGSYSGRAQALERYFPECRCEICVQDREDGDSSIKRRDELERAIFTCQMDRYSLDQVRDFTSHVSATYSNSRGPIRPLLARMHVLTADKLRSIMSSSLAAYHREACQEDFKALEASGIRVIDKATTGDTDPSLLPIATDLIPTISHFHNIIVILFHIVRFFRQIEKCQSRAISWLKAALWVHDCSVGGGKEMFFYLWLPFFERSNRLAEFIKTTLELS